MTSASHRGERDYLVAVEIDHMLGQRRDSSRLVATRQCQSGETSQKSRSSKCRAVICQYGLPAVSLMGLMEPFGALRTEVVDANPLKEMVGPWGLEPQTSTVSR